MIWQAARATSAAPTFFPAITFGNPPSEYVDGALVHNNPIRLLMRETSSVWGSDVKFSCVLSVGTGTPQTRKLGSMGHQVLLACAKLATHSENIARNFKADNMDGLVKENVYFRFNVIQGLQDIRLDGWQALGLIDAATKAYLSEATADVEACSKRLQPTEAAHVAGSSSECVASYESFLNLF